MYSKKSLAALCRLVIQPEEYFRGKVEDPDLVVKKKKKKSEMPAAMVVMADVELAIKTAKDLLARLDVRAPSDKWDIVLGDGFYDAGEDIDISEIRHDLW